MGSIRFPALRVTILCEHGSETCWKKYWCYRKIYTHVQQSNAKKEHCAQTCAWVGMGSAQPYLVAAPRDMGEIYFISLSNRSFNTGHFLYISNIFIEIPCITPVYISTHVFWLSLWLKKMGLSLNVSVDIEFLFQTM